MADRPPRASLTNMNNNTTHEFLVNPQFFEDQIEVEFNRIQPIGLSHRRLQYVGTGNKTTSLEIFICRDLMNRFISNSLQHPTIAQRSAWLEALCYPVSSQDYARVGPPRVLFVWPSVTSRIVRVTSWRKLHRTFVTDTLEEDEIVINLGIEEDVERRRLMEDVIAAGSQHANFELFRF